MKYIYPHTTRPKIEWRFDEQKRLIMALPDAEDRRNLLRWFESGRYPIEHLERWLFAKIRLKFGLRYQMGSQQTVVALYGGSIVYDPKTFDVWADPDYAIYDSRGGIDTLAKTGQCIWQYYENQEKK